MAIKFRCRNCRQFLGISLARAGQIVNCPTCGRTIRVPDLDGRVRPLPSPKLDLEDSGLVKALGEVAKIGQPPSTEEMDINAALNPAAAEDVIEPIPLPEPTPLDPPKAIEVPAAPRAVAVDVASEESPTTDAPSDPIAELAHLAGELPAAARGTGPRDSRARRLKDQLLAPPVIVALFVVALVFLCVGIWVGSTALSSSAAPEKSEETSDRAGRCGRTTTVLADFDSIKHQTSAFHSEGAAADGMPVATPARVPALNPKPAALARPT